MEDTPALGFELTFIPRKRGQWQEYLDLDEAKVAASRLNTALAADPDVVQARAAEGLDDRLPLFTAKADPFRVMWSPGQPHQAWCIEVHNQPLRACSILRTASPVSLALEALYRHARKLRLYPHIERRAKDGTVLDYPTGGGHIHVGLMGLWKGGPHYLSHLRMLETAIALDIANLPLLRWTFSQWSDDSNSNTPITRELCKEAETIRRRKRLSRMAMVDWAYGEVLSSSTFKQRFTAGYKEAQMFTWEWRMFDMPRTVAELRLQVGFLNAWLERRVQQIDAIAGAEPVRVRRKLAADWIKRVLSYRLTVREWDRLTRDEAYAQATMRVFLRELDLDPEPIMSAFWDRGYGRRRLYGTFA